MSTAIKLRGDTTANWATNSTVILSNREIAVDTTLNRFKIGDGVSTWAQLNFMDKSIEDALLLCAPSDSPVFTSSTTFPISTAPIANNSAGTTGEVRFTTSGIFICLVGGLDGFATWVKANIATF